MNSNNMPKILITGGSGRLGTELQALIPGLIAPTSDEMDIANKDQVLKFISEIQPGIIVNCAAYTNVSGAETEREKCWQINVEGTRNIALAADSVGAKLVQISTDYVFDGEKGFYKENDIPGPVANYYALTKLVAEESARSAKEYLIIRTSFRERIFQYPKAVKDSFTSQDYIDIIAQEIALAIRNALQIKECVLHIGTERKSTYDLAVRRSPNVEPITRADLPVKIPKDVSLDTSLWSSIKATLQ